MSTNWITAVLILMVLLLNSNVRANDSGKHLFILAGQSNMARLDPTQVFQPMVEEAFGKENVLVVKEVESGQSILRWSRAWDPKKGGEPPIDQKTDKPGKIGDVYDRLKAQLQQKLKGETIETVTFCWMQGESDTYAPRCNVYKEALLGLVEQLSADLGRDDLNVVIGRISDARMQNPSWVEIRQVQVALAESQDRWAWINTDDCNDGPADNGTSVFKNDVHYSDAGKKCFAERLARKAVELIKRKGSTEPTKAKRNATLDLRTPPMTTDEPGPGRRVRQVALEYKGTDVYHALYLPSDWRPGRKYPIIVEYTGNKFPTSGSTGEIKDANLGYGMSGGVGFIWVCMPYVEKGRKKNAVTWWGDKQATVDYCKTNLPRICKEFGGDSKNVFICGFSRGAIGASYIGLADDEIAVLWKGMFTHDHFDGERKWDYPACDRKSALARLARLKGRPVLVCGMGATEVRENYLKDHLNLARFTFLDVPTSKIFKIPEGDVIHPHTDLWMHKESTYRKQARAWLAKTLGENSQRDKASDEK